MHCQEKWLAYFSSKKKCSEVSVKLWFFFVLQVHAPYLDLSSFTPLVRHGVPTQKIEKSSLAARLSLRLNPGRRLSKYLYTFKH